MWFLLLYLVSGIITARFFERKHFRVAMTAHAIMFTVALFFVLLMQDNLAISVFLRRMLGAKTYSVLKGMFLFEGMEGSACFALIAVEVMIILLSFVAALISAARLISVARIANAGPKLLHGLKNSTRVTAKAFNFNYGNTYILRVHCRMNS